MDTYAEIVNTHRKYLLRLRHAARCESATCSSAKRCYADKMLLRHIQQCDTPTTECKNSRCTSTRCLLSHYHTCTTLACPVCPFVKHAVQRNDEEDTAKTPCTSPVDSLAQKFSHVMMCRGCDNSECLSHRDQLVHILSCDDASCANCHAFDIIRTVHLSACQDPLCAFPGCFSERCGPALKRLLGHETKQTPAPAHAKAG